MGTCVDALILGGSEGVPEANGPIGCAATTGQKSMLVWGPGDGLNRRYVLVELADRAVLLGRPDQKLVVVSSRGQPLLFE